MSQITSVLGCSARTMYAGGQRSVLTRVLFVLFCCAAAGNFGYGQSAVKSQDEVADPTTSLPTLRPRLRLPDRENLQLNLVAKLDPDSATENSGLVKSRSHDNVLWFLNDSGNEPRIYPIDRFGKGIVKNSPDESRGVLVQGAKNKDWEDIAVDDVGNVIIADVGNNGNKRRDLTLYFVREPSDADKSVEVDHQVVVRYPDQLAFPAPEDNFNFDCEAVFTVDDDVYFLTKHRSDDLTKLYCLPDAKNSTDGLLKLVDRFDTHGGVTAADCSADGLSLVVTTYQSVWLFDRATKSDSFFDGNVWWAPYVSKQVEAVCFDGPDRILLADEQLGSLYSVSRTELTKVQDRDRTAEELSAPKSLPQVQDLETLAPGAWTMVVLPDTQYYFDRTRRIPPSPEVVDGMLDWIVCERDKRQIRVVVHVGDIVDNDTDDEWQTAKTTFEKLNGVVPLILTTGNHDYEQNAARRQTKFNSYFSAATILPTSSTGDVRLCGTFEADRLENAAYEYVAPDGRAWLFVALEWGPREAVVSWADSLLSDPRYKKHTAVLVNHAYLYHDNTRLDWTAKGKSQNGNPLSYGTAANGDSNDGEKLWQKLVSRHSQFQMVLCGHVTGTVEDRMALGDRSEVGYRLSVGPKGNRVHQMLFNAQRQGDAGDGWLRLLEFSPDQRTVIVKTYSPWRDAKGLTAWRTDEDDHFRITLTHF
jgi:hypothetical protein